MDLGLRLLHRSLTLQQSGCIAFSLTQNHFVARINQEFHWVPLSLYRVEGRAFVTFGFKVLPYIYRISLCYTWWLREFSSSLERCVFSLICLPSLCFGTIYPALVGETEYEMLSVLCRLRDTHSRECFIFFTGVDCARNEKISSGFLSPHTC